MEGSLFTLLALHTYNTSSWKAKVTEGVCGEQQMGKLQVKYKISNSPWWQHIRQHPFYCQSKTYSFKKTKQKALLSASMHAKQLLLSTVCPVTHCATMNWHMVLIQGI